MKRIVIKCGGSIMNELTPLFFESLIDLKNKGYQLIFVHGGGPAINKMLRLYDVPLQFEDGLRKTTSEVMEIVEMVLAGESNRKLTALLESQGFKTFGLNGSDGGLLEAEFINEEKLGFVGDITSVNHEILELFLQKDYIPVITPIAVTKQGIKLNTNADYAAAAIANAIGADQCIFVTDVDGIIIDEALSPQLDTDEVKQYIQSGDITGGMIPKVKSALTAIEKGIKSVMIVSGKNKIFSDSNWIGTKICAKEGAIL